MRHFRKWLAWFWSSLALLVSAWLVVAAPPVKPYSEICERNVFGLRPPPPAHPQPPPAPVPKIVPVGIATILGVKQALLKVYYPAHPPQPPREDSCVLTVGRREGPIEVLAINEAEGKIEIENSGTTMELILDRDAPRQQTSPLVAGQWPRRVQ